jgi:catechol 2,3-dioxygenase-like lactoylglutathione lyase family enzyme
MTQIKSHIGPTRRPGELGVHSIDHFNLVVPSLKDAERFYLSFGLDVRAEGDALSVTTHGAAHRWGALVEGPQKKLSYLSFGAFADDLPRFREKLQSCDVRQIDPPPGFESNGIWFRDPDGLLIEVRVGEKTSPNEKPVCINEQGRIGAQNAPNRSAVSPVRPRRLAHILIFASDVARAIRFYTSVLGLRLSDRSGDGIAFMHGIHGSDHHLIALAKSNGPGLHHLSWDVESIHQIGLGAMQMADKGFAGGWGLGRHVLGSNYFHYVRDPWGSYSEYSSDIDYIPVNYDWQAGDHSADDAFYVWGPVPPADFAFNYETAMT